MFLPAPRLGYENSDGNVDRESRTESGRTERHHHHHSRLRYMSTTTQISLVKVNILEFEEAAWNQTFIVVYLIVSAALMSLIYYWIAWDIAKML